MKTSKGFTLIEIMIAISIVALFTVVPVLLYNNTLKKARDDKRRADLGKVGIALESYKTENGEYPPNLEDLVTQGFIEEVPEDPREGTTTGSFIFDYVYATDGITYTISALMEDGLVVGTSESVSCTIMQGKAKGTGMGQLTGSVLLTGNVKNNSFVGTFNGSATGMTPGSVSGTANCTVEGNLDGTVGGMVSISAVANMQDQLSGMLQGTVSEITGNIHIVDSTNLQGKTTNIAILPSATGVLPSITAYVSPTIYTGSSPSPTRTPTPSVTTAPTNVNSPVPTGTTVVPTQFVPTNQPLPTPTSAYYPNEPALALVKTVSDPTISYNQQYMYAISVFSGTVNNVTINVSDIFNYKLVVLGVSTTNGTCNHTDNSISCSVQARAGVPVTITVQAQLNTFYAWPGDVIPNYATATNTLGAYAQSDTVYVQVN